MKEMHMLRQAALPAYPTPAPEALDYGYGCRYQAEEDAARQRELEGEAESEGEAYREPVELRLRCTL